MIRVQPIDGPWQGLGSDLYPGVFPEDIQPVWGPAGPESLTFTLKRPARQVHADLLPFTPVEMYADDRAVGEPLWAGYTMQSPPSGKGEPTQVSCVGWHYYRDDEPRSFYYVHADLSEWQDARTAPFKFPGSLDRWVQNGVVQADGGALTIGFPKGATVDSAAFVGVILDLGPAQTCERLVVEWDRKNFTSDFYFRATAMETIDSNPSAFEIVGADANDDVWRNRRDSWSFSPGATNRYLVVWLFYNQPTAALMNFDHLVRLGPMRVFAKPEYMSAVVGNATGGESVLTADQVIKTTSDMLPLLSGDRSRVTAVTFPIRELKFLREDATARQGQEAANDYHGYRLGIDAARRPFFLPQPSVPRLQIDALAHGVKFRDLSTNDGTEIYNKVSVRGRDGSGDDVRLDRYITDYVAGLELPRGGLTNPTFAADASGWTGVTRVTTSPVDSAPAAGEVNTSDARTTMSGADFIVGVPYRVTWRMANPLSTEATVSVKFGVVGESAELAALKLAAGAGYATYSLTWVPRSTVPAASVRWRVFGSPVVGVRIDSFTLTEVQSGLLGRRRRVRSFTLNVAAATDAEAMEALARAFLLAHRSTPFKGSVEITGAPLVDLVTQAPVQANELGRYYGEMVRIVGVPDPDTGALQSRDGIIASVTGLDPAGVAIDSERRSLEALMARMQVVQGV